MNIDGKKLLAEINEDITHYQLEIDGAVKAGWFQKAASLDLKIAGIKTVKQMIERGDFFINKP